MSRMDKALSARLSMYVLIALCFCLAGFTAHFVTESLVPLFELTSTEAAEPAGDLSSAVDDIEDDYVMPVFGALDLNVFISSIPQKILNFLHIVFSPLLLPPNFI